MPTESDILEKGRLRFNSARSDDKSERLLADLDTRFAINDDGCQWDPSTRALRQKKNPPRPCLVMNKIPEKIDQMEGEFRQLRPSVKIRAVDSKGDPKIAEIIGGMIRHIEYNSTARAAYNTSHSSVLYSGRGAWRINIVDSEDDPFEQDIVIDRIPNALSVTWDPNAKKIDKSDGDFLFISEDMAEEVFKKEYPKASIADWPDEDSYNGWRGDKTVRIVEYWWKEKGTKTAYRVDRNGTKMTVWEQKEGDELIGTKEVNHPKVRWCKMNANEILEGPFDDWPGKYIPIIIEIGKEVNVNGKSKTRGMVRFAKEPQQMYNYFATSETEQLQGTKYPFFMTPAMMGPHQDQWDNMATSNYTYAYYEIDPKSPTSLPSKQDPQQASTALIVAKQALEHDIMSAMNVYRASLGDEGKEISGTAIQARQRQGTIGGFTYTNNFEFAYIHSMRILIDIIPEVYSSEQIQRIRGEDDTDKMVPINARPDSPLTAGIDPELIVKNDASEYINDITVGKYDVVATIGPPYATQREEALNMMIGLLERIPRLAEAAPDLIVSLMDIPMSAELLKRAKKLVPPGLRTLDPGEEPPPRMGPTPEQMIKMKEVEVKFMEQARKDFKTEIDSLLTVAKAETQEVGQQLEEYKIQVEEIKAGMPKQGVE